MNFKTVELANFRSYEKQRFTFGQGLNIVIGPNGTGKTNLLEALYVLGNTKSFRAKDSQLIRHGQEWYRLDAQTNTGAVSIRYQSTGRLKTIKRGSKKIKPEDYIGMVAVVLFEPASLSIISGAPEDRRKFLNAVLAGIDRRYLQTLISYRHVIKQRNALLRGRSLSDVQKQVFPWDLKLAELADYLHQKRHQFVEFLGEHINEHYQKIASHNPALTVRYQSGTEGPDYASQLLEKLSIGLERDLIMGHTSSGPHRDDLAFVYQGKTAQAVASRGEVRTLVLALKLLELSFIESVSGQKPILLFDDVFSELDKSRRQFLLGRLKGHQTIITATDLTGFKTGLPKAHNIIKL